jgi:hypothetical protein
MAPAVTLTVKASLLITQIWRKFYRLMSNWLHLTLAPRHFRNLFLNTWAKLCSTMRMGLGGTVTSKRPMEAWLIMEAMFTHPLRNLIKICALMIPYIGYHLIKSTGILMTTKTGIARRRLKTWVWGIASWGRVSTGCKHTIQLQVTLGSSMLKQAILNIQRKS